MKRQGAIDADAKAGFRPEHEADRAQASALVIAHNSGRHPSSQRDENPLAQGCEERATLGEFAIRFSTLKGLKQFFQNAPVMHTTAATLSGLCVHESIPQGSSFLATLGWRMESLWDSRICSFELRAETRTKVRAPRAMLRLPLVVILALLMSASVTMADDSSLKPLADPRPILQDLQRKMSSLRSVYLDFTQERHLKLFTEPLKSEGVMLMERPNP